MGRAAAKSLSAKQVETETRVGYHADGASTGLYLQVTESNFGVTRSWLFRYTSPTTRKRRELGLGSSRTRKLADARARSAELRLLVLNGVDPKDERDKQRAMAVTNRLSRITFDEAVVQCREARSLEWKNIKHAQQWSNTLATYASPILGKIPVDQITTELIHRVLQPIWVTKTETATRVRQRIETVLDWCKARGYCSGENPARLRGALGELLPKSQKIKKIRHHPAIPHQQINKFVMALRTQGGAAPLALEFMLLTAARTGELTAARWDEVDFDGMVWTVPASRMKAGKEHRVPLSRRAADILRVMKAATQSEYIFPGHSASKNSHMSSGTCRAAMKRVDGYSEYTPHGLRSTFRDWASETTNFANETLEIALAHTIPNKAEAAYRRQDQLEKRRKLMQQWANHIETTQTEAVVTPLLKRGER
ncbi:MAG: tyrosine-type recombinase/integrase [Proteobacteria bacterium]|nr:tyrosine-type recombinase/integrase [Pseudomonadota bacterium]MDA0868720.1 tyrosine-type recombinase/integrase [Pseudomonadota bacterium]MDA1207580.1 tyrosine-type recombinase/integrase [Pseudomonadota bacterium]